MNCQNYNTADQEQEDNNSSYYLSITDNDTNVMKEIYLDDLEFKILNTAVQQNRGIVNLLSNKEIIYGLFRKGLITISDDNLELAVVSDVIAFLLNPKTTADFSDNPFLEENKPNGFFKMFENKSICFCFL